MFHHSVFYILNITSKLSILEIDQGTVYKYPLSVDAQMTIGECESVNWSIAQVTLGYVNAEDSCKTAVL